jgi:hypothetical protein
MTVETESVTPVATGTLVLGQNLPAGSYRLYFQARSDSVVAQQVLVQIFQGSTALTLTGGAGSKGHYGYLWDAAYWTPSTTYPVTMDLWPYVNFNLTTNEVITVKLSSFGGGAGKSFWLRTVRLVKL